MAVSDAMDEKQLETALVLRADLQNQAMVKNVKDENGNAILIITSENTDCLMEAAGMLMDEERVTQEKSDTAFVKNGSAELAASLSFPCWY